MDLKELYYENSIDKQLVISGDGVGITNADVDSESMELEESLCSEKCLTFGCCEASVFRIRVRNHVAPLKGKRITVSEYLGGDRKNSYTFGVYTVDSDKPEANRTYRDIIAYDDMYRIINTDVAGWYNGLAFPMTLKQFRNSFFAWFGIVQEDSELVNDGMMVEETIKPGELSGGTVITCICEINGCFGHIGRDGKFRYVFLTEITDTVYPGNALYPRNNLLPSYGETVKTGRNRYMKCTYEDFKTPKIGRLQVRQEENDIGAIVGTGKECYIVEDNFLCYGKDAAELKETAEKLLSVISRVSPYHPYSCTAIGNPCVGLGEIVSIYETRMFIESYVLRRVLKGIQALKDTLEAGGSDSYGGNVNSVHKSIIQLKGKVNVLTRTADETRSEIKDMERGLSSSITQTAEKIETEVTRAREAEKTLSSRITQTEEKIDLEVAKGDISSRLSMESGKISISSDRFVLDSTNCKIEADGTLTARNGKFTGTIESGNAVITGGKINIAAVSADSAISITYSGSRSSMTGNGLFITSAYAGTYIQGNYAGFGGSVHVDGYLYASNIRAKTGSTITFGDKVVFNDIEFGYGKTITFNGTVEMKGTVKIGGSSVSSIGFFGSSGNTRKTISRLYSATETNNMNKINEVIDALKAYGLFG